MNIKFFKSNINLQNPCVEIIFNILISNELEFCSKSSAKKSISNFIRIENK